jgi:hypothetical protein
MTRPQIVQDAEIALVLLGLFGRLTSGLVVHFYLKRSPTYRAEGGSAMDWIELTQIRRSHAAGGEVPDWVFVIANSSMLVWIIGLVLLLLDLIGVW